MKKHLTTTGSLQSERNKQAYMSICRYRCETRAVYLRWAVLQNTVRAGGTAGAKFCRAFEKPLAQGTDHLIEFIGKFRGVESERSAAPGAFKFWCAGIKVRCQRSDAADLWSSPRLLSPPMQTISSGRMGYRFSSISQAPCSFPAGGWGSIFFFHFRGGFSPFEMASRMTS